MAPPEAAPATQAAPAPAAPDRPALDPAVEAAIGPIAEGKARIVFFRPSKFAGAAIGFIVREGEAELGKLRSGNFFTVQAEPGKHTYTVRTEAADNAILEVEAGETYFVMGSISMGFMVGHPHLACTDVASFQGALPKLSPSKPLS